MRWIVMWGLQSATKTPLHNSYYILDTRLAPTVWNVFCYLGTAATRKQADTQTNRQRIKRIMNLVTVKVIREEKILNGDPK